MCHAHVFSPTLNGVALRLPCGRLGMFQPELGALRYHGYWVLTEPFAHWPAPARGIPPREAIRRLSEMMSSMVETTQGLTGLASRMIRRTPAFSFLLLPNLRNCKFAGYLLAILHLTGYSDPQTRKGIRGGKGGGGGKKRKKGKEN